MLWNMDNMASRSLLILFIFVLREELHIYAEKMFYIFHLWYSTKNTKLLQWMSDGKFSVFTSSYVNTAPYQSASRIHKRYIINSYINTHWNWKNEKLCGNTTPLGRSVLTKFRVFPISMSVDITVHLYGKNVLCFFYNIAQNYFNGWATGNFPCLHWVM